MAEHPNTEIVRSFFKAWAEADLDTILAVLAPDVSWHQPSSSTGSGPRDMNGLDELSACNAMVQEFSGGTFRADPVEFFSGDQCVTAISHNRARRGEKQLDLRMAMCFRIEEGKIVDVREAVDDYDHWVDFWA